jgi:hypothetical protein
MRNFLIANYSLTGASALNLPEIECNPGEIISFDVLIESVTGTPTAASLAAKFQISPIEFNGLNLNAEVSGTQPWIDVVAADTFTGHLLLDGAWPASLADQTAAYKLVNRRFRAPALGCLVRLVLTPSFTNGTSPGFDLTVAAAIE